MKMTKIPMLLSVMIIGAIALSACGGVVPDAGAITFDLGDNGVETNDVDNALNEDVNNDLNDDQDNDLDEDLNEDLDEDLDEDQAEDTDEDFTIVGVVEAIDGNTITVNGETFTVTLEEGVTLEDLFSVGDEFKIEFVLNEDGSITILEVEFEGGDDFDDDLDDVDDDDEDENNNDNENNDDNNNDNSSNGGSSGGSHDDNNNDNNHNND